MKVTKRRGRWVVDAYIYGRRRVKVYRTKREAEEAKAALINERKQRGRPAVNPFVTFEHYAQRFLEDCEADEVADATLRQYRSLVSRHVLPAFGKQKVRDISPADIRTFLHSKRRGEPGKTEQKALSKPSVRQIRSVLSLMLSLAVEDEVIFSNPAAKSSRKRRTRAKKQQERARIGDKVKAMTRDERNRFLALAGEREPGIYPAFMLMALAGLRHGECLGLRWESVDFEAKRLRVHEQLMIAATKSGEERFVDMAAPLEELLRDIHSSRREANLAAGQGGEMISGQRVVFPNLPVKPERREQQALERRVRRAMARCLKVAGLPAHFTPHSLRHTFCSLLITDGVSPVYVQQQAGHTSVDLTVRVYGSWFAVRAPGAMDRLAEGVAGAPSGNNSADSGNNLSTSVAGNLMPTGTCGGGGTDCSSSSP